MQTYAIRDNDGDTFAAGLTLAAAVLERDDAIQRGQRRAYIVDEVTGADVDDAVDDDLEALRSALRRQLGAVTLRPVMHDGSAVWAAVCAQHARGLHRFTLDGDTACWAWWETIGEVRAAVDTMSAGNPTGRPKAGEKIETRPVNARLPTALVERVDAEAARRGIDRTAAIRDALHDWLDLDPGR